MSDVADHIKTLTEIAEGREAAAHAEQLVMDGLQPYVDRFVKEDDHDPQVMRFLRVYNDAKSNHRWAQKEAAAARFALSLVPSLQDSEV